MQYSNENSLDKTAKSDTITPLGQQVSSVSVSDYEAIISALIHDIRSPLGVLTSIRELLSHNDSSNPSCKQDYLHYLDSAVAQTRQIIEDAAQIRNLISGTYFYDKTRIDIRDMISDAVKKASMTTYGKEIQFDLQELPAFPANVFMDRKIAEQVLLRLLEECSHYTSRPGKMVIRTAMDNDFLTVKIQPAEASFCLYCNRKPPQAELHGRMGHTRKGVSLYTLSLCHHVMSESGGALNVDTAQDSFTAIVAFPISA